MGSFVKKGRKSLESKKLRGGQQAAGAPAVRAEARGHQPADSRAGPPARVSNHRRKQLRNRVPEGVFDAVQEAAMRFAPPD